MPRAIPAARPTRRGRRAAPRPAATPVRRVDPASATEPAAGFRLPRLSSVTSRRTHTASDARAAKLARALLSAGVADPALWVATERDPLEFARRAFADWTLRHTGAEAMHWDLHACLLPAGWDQYQEDDAEGTRSGMRFRIDVEAMHYARIVAGPTMERLEEAAGPEAASSFYHALSESLNRWLFIFDRHESSHLVETEEDWTAGLAEDDPEYFEVVPLEVPECLKTPALTGAMGRALAAAIPEEELRQTYLAAFDLLDLAASADSDTARAFREDEFRDLDTPLPAAVLQFWRHDRVEADIDAYGQSALETSHAPAVVFYLDAARPATVRSAFERYALFCRVMRAASDLIDRMPETSDGTTLDD